MKRFITAAGILMSLLLNQGCENEQLEAEAQLRPVRYVVVGDPAAFRSRTFSGSSRSAHETRLSFQVPGTVVELPVQVGDLLRKGDLLARLDPSQYELQVQQSKASLVQAQANARNAQANYERTRGLYENYNASRNDLDSARANAESARAQQSAAEKALELAGLNLSYTRLTVDIDCSIAALSVEVNENVNAGTQIAQVNCGSDLEVAIDVPESLIAAIKQDMPVEVLFDAVPGRVFEGHVFEVGISSSGVSATFPVSVKLDKPDPALRSGLAAKVTFAFASETGREAHLVPLSAVINDVEGPFVYIADPAQRDGQATVRRKTVRLGELTDQGMEVLEGLASGDRVVTAGVTVIRDGQRVLLP